MKLISSPAKAWEEISMEEDRRKVFMAFVYPMIGLCGLSVFIGSLLTNGWGGPQSFQIAMTNCCAVAGLGGDSKRYRDGSFEYYISEPVIENDPKSVGSFILAAIEYEKMTDK